MQPADWAWWCGLLFGAAPLLALVFWHFTDTYYRIGLHGRCKLPPGHMGLPFVGDTLALLWYFKVVRRPDEFIAAKKRRYGDGVAMYRTHLFGAPTVLFCSPAANKFVLQSSDSFGIRWPAPELVGVSSIANVEGSQHIRLRGFVGVAVNQPTSLRKFTLVVQPRLAEALGSWAEKGNIITATEIRKVTFDNICKMFVSMDPSPLTEKIRQWVAGMIAGVRATPLDIPGTTFHHARRCRRKLNVVFREELNTRRKNEAAELKDDLMSGLMRMEDEEGNKLSDDEIVDSIVSLVVGGYEPACSAMMWAVYHLAKSPDVLAKLREENAAMSREMNLAGSSFISYDDILKMKYTAKVVQESIRLANIVPLVFRVAHRDVEYGGYTIPKGWRVVVWLRSIHTDANYYPDPLTFNPDRWDEPAKAGTNLVFGAGIRTCAGNMFARMQITILLHHLSVGYKWELLNPDAAINYLPHPKPVDGAAMAFRKNEELLGSI